MDKIANHLECYNHKLFESTLHYRKIMLITFQNDQVKSFGKYNILQYVKFNVHARNVILTVYSTAKSKLTPNRYGKSSFIKYPFMFILVYSANNVLLLYKSNLSNSCLNTLEIVLVSIGASVVRPIAIN